MLHPSLADVFPEQPPGYRWIEGEPAFDPARHLQLEQPRRSWTLADLGYGADFVAAQASPLAMFSPARLLSDRGIAALQEVVRLLAPHVRHTPDGHRSTGYLRGTVFMSRFMRDLARSPEVAAFASELFGTPLLPHTMVYQQGHLNFPPRDLARNIDEWHHDFVGFDYVLMCHDPAACKGGEFRYFLGTREEGHAIVAAGEAIPDERIVTPRFPGPGYACFMQGSAVYHCASPLREPAWRVSLVNAYVSLDVEKPDPTRTFFVAAEGLYDWLKDEREAGHWWGEYARHTAWLGREKLSRLLKRLPIGASRAQALAALRHAASDLERAIATIEAGPLPHEEMEALRRRQDAEALDRRGGAVPHARAMPGKSG